MLPIILKILSIFGIILLILLGIILLMALTVLFLPVRYSIYGYRKEDLKIRVKLRWLFGLLRIRYEYPAPGEIKAKLLWFNLISGGDKPPKKRKTKKKSESTPDKETGYVQNSNIDGKKNTITQEVPPEKASDKSDKTAYEPERENLFVRIYQKIKYTILKIYGKIKHIFEEFIFYKDLFTEEETKALVKHGFSRLGKILCRLKPKKLKAKLLVGTGSPDTTGYLLGLYGILSPHIKKPNYLDLTPDFNRAVLEGSLYAKGHINAFQILKQVLPLVFDKRIRSFRNKLNSHKSKEAA